MVLTTQNISRKTVYTCPIVRLLAILVLVPASSSVVGCQYSRADKIAQNLECMDEELKVDQKQMDYIRASLSKLFQWEAYWPGLDEERQLAYKSGQKVSIVVFSLKRGVIVVVPSLENSVIKFAKSRQGQISNPQFFASGKTVSFEGDKLIAVAKSLGDWREFSFTYRTRKVAISNASSH